MLQFPARSTHSQSSTLQSVLSYPGKTCSLMTSIEQWYSRRLTALETHTVKQALHSLFTESTTTPSFNWVFHRHFLSSRNDRLQNKFVIGKKKKKSFIGYLESRAMVDAVFVSFSSGLYQV
ncbi:hypothetical protein TNCV_5120251 [Trichonephila clavipes]|nr:hypothetical protein TNCV_5120251 [Trichonephila clavipes]